MQDPPGSLVSCCPATPPSRVWALLEMQIVRPHPRPASPESPGVRGGGLDVWVVTDPAGDPGPGSRVGASVYRESE